MFQNVNIRNSSKIGTPINIRRTNKETVVSLKGLFAVTRTRHPERLYKDSNEYTICKIGEIEEIEKQQSLNGNEFADAFSSVMGPKHPGRLRLYRRRLQRFL
ncbi:hypothetical protein AABB24_036979 [Solanum stoloniferum]|uniref:Uncharacterized protein n=1 Tax=Solanum stoloniferum TaxID=62892 RepID=A0ABD2R2T9_9SOLN